MKMTLEVSAHLLIEAEKLAAEQRRPMRAIVEDALRLYLSQASGLKPRPAKLDLPVCDAGRPLPGVDLNDTSRLLEIE